MNPGHFGLRLETQGSRHALLLSGELDLASTPELEAEARRLCREGADELVLDLSELDFMDSTGLRALLTCMHLCQERGCVFLVTPGRPQVERLFEVVGAREALPFRSKPAG
jgi:anti-anti-sigma factor